MSGDLFLKIVSDLTAIPSDLPFTIAPFWMNEPFLESRLFDFLEIINRKLPGAWIRFSTNGVALDDEKLTALRKVRNVKTLNVSVNEHSDSGRYELMGCSFQPLEERLRTIHERKRQGLLPFEVTLSRVAGDSRRDKGFRQWAAESYPLFRCLVMPPLDWMGTVPANTPPVPDAGCINWFTMTVASDGTVPFCCLDAACRFPAGDASKENLLRIYDRPQANQFRLRAADRTRIDPCRHCSSLGVRLFSDKRVVYDR